MATTALLAQQTANSNDGYNKPLTNSLNHNSRDVTPSFTQTAVPEKTGTGGPMTFEPNSISAAGGNYGQPEMSFNQANNVSPMANHTSNTSLYSVRGPGADM